MPLRHGGIADFELRYELVGPPGAPLLIVAGGISAGRHVVASRGVSRRRLVAGPGRRPSAATGSSPSTGSALTVRSTCRSIPPTRPKRSPGCSTNWGSRAPPHSSALPMARWSGMHLAARHPNRIGALLAISAADKPHPYRQRLPCAAAPGARPGRSRVAIQPRVSRWPGRWPCSPIARRRSSPSGSLPSPKCRAIGVRVAAEDYLDAQGARHCHRMSAIAYRRLSESIDLHRIDPDEHRLPADAGRRRPRCAGSR